MAACEILYRSDRVTAVLQDFGTPTTFITFNDMGLLANGDIFWGRDLFARTKTSAIGIMSAAPNWYPLTDMVAIADLVRDRFGARRLITYGFSQGGYGALKYPSLFGATLALGFSPQWSIDPADVRAFDNRYSEHYDPMLRNGERIQAHDLCAANFIFYDPAHTIDRVHARELLRLGPVTQVLVPFSDHGSVMVLSEGRQGRKLVELCCSGEKVTAPKLRQLLRAGRASSPYYHAQKIKRLLPTRNRHGGFLKRELDQLPEGVEKSRHMIHYYLEQHDFVTARKILETLSDSDLMSFDCGLYWDLYHHLGFSYGEARLAPLFKLRYPDHMFNRLHGVRSMVRLGWRDEAIAELAELSRMPGAAINLAQFAELYAQLDRPDLASQLAAEVYQDRALALPKRIQTGFEVANIWRSHRARAQLFHELRSLEELCAGRPADLLRLAAMYLDIGETGFTQRIVDQTLAINPDDRQAAILQAAIAAAGGKTETANARIARLLDTPDDQPDLWVSLSEVAEKISNLPASLRAMRAAVALRPDWWDARLRMTDLLVKAGQITGALAELRTLYASPASRTILAKPCAALARLCGSPELALDFVAAWHNGHPDDVHAVLAWCNEAIENKNPAAAQTTLTAFIAKLENGDFLMSEDYKALIETARRVNYPLEARAVRAAVARYPADETFRNLQRRDSFAQRFYVENTPPPRKHSLMEKLGLRR